MSNCVRDDFGCGCGCGKDYGYGNYYGYYPYNNHKDCDVCYRIGYEECAREAFRGKLDAERKILNEFYHY